MGRGRSELIDQKGFFDQWGELGEWEGGESDEREGGDRFSPSLPSSVYCVNICKELM